MSDVQSPIIKYFEFTHLPAHLRDVSRPMAELAKEMDYKLPDCAEKSAGLRKLLEAKDCFVRAALPLIAMLLVTVATSSADAGWLLRRGAVCTNGSCATQASKSVTVERTVTKTVAVGETATAQGVANIMARLGRVGHFGGHRWYEGCGMASTPAGAYNICCYSRSRLVTYDVGYAQGRNGMWYCCRRYHP